MPIITCPECQHTKLSTLAENCPQCGALVSKVLQLVQPNASGRMDDRELNAWIQSCTLESGIEVKDANIGSILVWRDITRLPEVAFDWITQLKLMGTIQPPEWDVIHRLVNLKCIDLGNVDEKSVDWRRLSSIASLRELTFPFICGTLDVDVVLLALDRFYGLQRVKLPYAVGSKRDNSRCFDDFGVDCCEQLLRSAKSRFPRIEFLIEL